MNIENTVNIFKSTDKYTQIGCTIYYNNTKPEAGNHIYLYTNNGKSICGLITKVYKVGRNEFDIIINY